MLLSNKSFVFVSDNRKKIQVMLQAIYELQRVQSSLIKRLNSPFFLEENYNINGSNPPVNPAGILSIEIDNIELKS